MYNTPLAPYMGRIPYSLDATHRKLIGACNPILCPKWSFRYATFAAIAGVDPTDHAAAAARLPAVDGIDQWPLLSGRNLTAPRTELYGDGLYADGVWPAYLIQSTMKLLVGSVPFAVWYGRGRHFLGNPFPRLSHQPRDFLTSPAPCDVPQLLFVPIGACGMLIGA